jgi:hypothetical protein
MEYKRQFSLFLACGLMNHKKNIIIITLFLIFCVNLFSQSFESGKIMYVNSPEGLRIRAEPSINSRVVGMNSYGQCIWLLERSDVAVTIDGITAYWYNSSNGSGGNGWVFGGYLSENLPSNVPIISGIWEAENNRRLVYSFDLNHRYWIGRKESGGGRSGEWELSGNTLILREDGYEYGEIVPQEIYRYIISFINNNYIILRENRNEGEIKLIRSNNFY